MLMLTALSCVYKRKTTTWHVVWFTSQDS